MSQISNDIKNAVRGMENGQSYYKSVIRAAHADTVMPVLAMWNAVPTCKWRDFHPWLKAFESFIMLLSFFNHSTYWKRFAANAKKVPQGRVRTHLLLSIRRALYQLRQKSTFWAFLSKTLSRFKIFLTVIFFSSFNFFQVFYLLKWSDYAVMPPVSNYASA